jgi:hypothetical protein
MEALYNARPRPPISPLFAEQVPQSIGYLRSLVE